MKDFLVHMGHEVGEGMSNVALGCIVVILLMAIPAAGQPPQTQPSAPQTQPQSPQTQPQQQTFESPAAALAGLKEALQSKEPGSLMKIFGPEVTELKSGDPVQDASDMATFSRRVQAASRLEEDASDRVTVLVGPEEYPFPVPIVQKDGRWFFDTAAGKDEILNRRIGENELQAISVCRGYVAAQREYYALDPAGAGLPEYAQKLASTPGQRDGLYWQTQSDEPLSPLGPMVAQARAEGYAKTVKSNGTHQRQPYRGYLYKLLTRQGKTAPGGQMDYVINGHMVAGFALVAWPVDYESSGIMTFLVGPSGKIYQKDLGDKTEELAPAMDAFAPDDTWTPVEGD